MSFESDRTEQMRIFRFWLPMAGTWLMMAIEAPFLAAVIARLDDPKHNLAAFGVAYAVAILVEAPVIMILSASTALVEGAVSFRRLRSFTLAMNAAVTVFMLAILLTPAWTWIAEHGIGLPDRAVELSRVGLLLLVPWPGAIGYRRFYQGLLIRNGQTRRVAYGTVIRLTTVVTSSLVLVTMFRLPGAWVAAAGLSLGVCFEAVASRWMARGTVRRVCTEPGGPRDSEVTYRRIASFYAPLALTSVISLAVHPLVTFFMGHARFALESLAVLPVVNSLSFVFRSLGLSYQEVAIALLGRDENAHPGVARFARRLAVGASLANAVIVCTPLAWVWFRDVSGLTDELTEFALWPARIVALLPALSVLLSLQRAILVHGRRTAPLTWATLIEVGGIVTALIVLISGLDMVGVTAAAIAFLVGRIVSNLYLVPPCARTLRRSTTPIPAP